MKKCDSIVVLQKVDHNKCTAFIFPLKAFFGEKLHIHHHTLVQGTV